MTKRACYIAGPMRGRADFYFPIFFEAEAELKIAGWTVFNPARMDVISDGSWPNAAALAGTPPSHRVGLTTIVQTLNEDKFTPGHCRRYARRDCHVLLDYLCGEFGDAVVLLDGWTKSTGAVAEEGIAKWVALDRLTLFDALAKGGSL